ncbi:MAG: hypothetical protein IIZ92_05900 [Aquincola sp.]|uniref:hypothetical protein n=1 Tax=uncultured Aquincola sp. TaxID=886556 RepID=UPI0032B18CD1|nr:hypothetical protein [Aquincola sp.]
MNQLHPSTAPRRLGATLAATVAAALLAGCAASPKIEGQWTAPQRPTLRLAGAKVLVACEAVDPAVKRTCEDQMAGAVVAQGGSAVVAPQIMPPQPGQPVPDDQYLAPARQAGAIAVLATTVSAWAGGAGSGGGPAFSIGLGSFGFGGGHVGGGVGVAVPIGGGERRSTAYSASSRIIDARGGQVIWTARASAPPSDDIQGPMGGLATAILNGAQEAGVF